MTISEDATDKICLEETWRPKRKTFKADLITDQKRLVRGEQLLAARTALRVRDEQHHREWRVLMLPGESPAEEVGAIRGLMPKAFIVAADRVESSLLAAAAVGVDEIVQVDLEAFEKRGVHYRPPAKIWALGKFDLILMDLCSNVNATMRRLFRIYFEKALTPNGVMVFNFSYGRDVAEVFIALVKRYPETLPLIPDTVRGRLLYLFGGYGAIRSVMTYRGAAMPMCSVLLQRGSWTGGQYSYVACEPGDFELAVTCPDPAIMYACPAERIEALRRTNGALKAAWTRKLKGLTDVKFCPWCGLETENEFWLNPIQGSSSRQR